MARRWPGRVSSVATQAVGIRRALLVDGSASLYVALTGPSASGAAVPRPSPVGGARDHLVSRRIDSTIILVSLDNRARYPVDPRPLSRGRRGRAAVARRHCQSTVVLQL